jgi:hypothetical protein
MSLGTFLLGDRPLGHLVWWTGPGESSPERTAENAMTSALGVPVLERSGVFWIAPDFNTQLEALRSALRKFRGWELHTTEVRATTKTLDALRASATRDLDSKLNALSMELEALLAAQRVRASLLVRQLDTLERVRKQDEVNGRHLQLARDGLSTSLDEWARRIDAALCARIVA